MRGLQFLIVCSSLFLLSLEIVECQSLNGRNCRAINQYRFLEGGECSEYPKVEYKDNDGQIKRGYLRIGQDNRYYIVPTSPPCKGSSPPPFYFRIDEKKMLEVTTKTFVYALEEQRHSL